MNNTTTVERGAVAQASHQDRPERLYGVYFSEENGAGFLLMDKLASGAFGDVCTVLCVDDNQVAVRKQEKVAIPRYGGNQIQSIEVRHHIDHANVPELMYHREYEFSRWQGGPVTGIKTSSVWKYCNGGTMDKLCTSIDDLSETPLARACHPNMLPTLPEAFVFKAFETLLSTIIDIQNQGVVHNDAHIGNIFLHWPETDSTLPDILLGDFGLSETYPWKDYPRADLCAPFLISDYGLLPPRGYSFNANDPVNRFSELGLMAWYNMCRKDYLKLQEFLIIMVICSPYLSVAENGRKRARAMLGKPVNGFSEHLMQYILDLTEIISNTYGDFQPSATMDALKEFHGRVKEDAKVSLAKFDSLPANEKFTILNHFRPPVPEARPHTWPDRFFVVFAPDIHIIKYRRPNEYDLVLDRYTFERRRIKQRANGTWKVYPQGWDGDAENDDDAGDDNNYGSGKPGGGDGQNGTEGPGRNPRPKYQPKPGPDNTPPTHTPKKPRLKRTRFENDIELPDEDNMSISTLDLDEQPKWRHEEPEPMPWYQSSIFAEYLEEPADTSYIRTHPSIPFATPEWSRKDSETGSQGYFQPSSSGSTISKRSVGNTADEDYISLYASTLYPEPQRCHQDSPVPWYRDTTFEQDVDDPQDYEHETFPQSIECDRATIIASDLRSHEDSQSISCYGNVIMDRYLEDRSDENFISLDRYPPAWYKDSQPVPWDRNTIFERIPQRPQEDEHEVPLQPAEPGHVLANEPVSCSPSQSPASLKSTSTSTSASTVTVITSRSYQLNETHDASKTEPSSDSNSSYHSAKEHLHHAAEQHCEVTDGLESALNTMKPFTEITLPDPFNIGEAEESSSSSSSSSSSASEKEYMRSLIWDNDDESDSDSDSDDDDDSDCDSDDSFDIYRSLAEEYASMYTQARKDQWRREKKNGIGYDRI